MECRRCGRQLAPGEIHLTIGDGGRATAVAVAFGSPTSLCAVPIHLLPQAYLCLGCRQFLFEFQEQGVCPLCGQPALKTE